MKPLIKADLSVPVKVLEAWNGKKTRGDVQKLTSYTGLSKPIIIKALKHGKATPELVLKISRYFSKKHHPTSEDLEKKALEILNHCDL